jgi:hypothetical protein
MENGKENMWKDPIVEEIRKIREEFAARHNYDLREMYKTLKKMEAESNRPHLSFPPRRIQQTSAPEDSD